MFVLLNGVIFPVMYYCFSTFRYAFDEFSFPIIPIFCMPIFFFALAFGQTFTKAYPHWAHVELKELVIALGFFVFSISFYKGVNAIRDDNLD